MTLEEVKRHVKGINAYPLWIECDDDNSINDWYGSNTIKWLKHDTYGRQWRCWPRKPTEAERQAAGWEDAEYGKNTR